MKSLFFDNTTVTGKILLSLFLILFSSLIGLLTATHAIWIVYILGMFFVTYLLFNWKASIYILLISVLFSGYVVPIGNAGIRPEHIVMLLAFGSTLFHYILTKKRKFQFNMQSVLLILFIGYSFIVSYLNSPVLKDSYFGIMQLAIAVTGFIIIIQTYNFNQELVYKFIKFLFITAAVLETIYGLIAFTIYNTTGVNIGGIVTGQSGFSVVTLKGTLVEANIFGSYISACALFVLSLIISRVHQKHNTLLITCFIILISGLLLSWTRSAWIGFIIGFLFLLITYNKKAINLKNIFRFGLVTIFIFLPLFLLISHVFNQSSESGVFFYKLTNLFQSDGGTGQHRLGEFSLALAHWQSHPILGTGYFSIKAFGENLWISNSNILVLHDTGILGLVLFNIIVLSIVLKGVKLSFKPSPISYKNKAYIIGLTAGIIQLLFAFNFTPSHTLAFFWVCLGLLYVLTKLNKQQKL